MISGGTLTFNQRSKPLAEHHVERQRFSNPGWVVASTFGAITCSGKKKWIRDVTFWPEVFEVILHNSKIKHRTVCCETSI